MLKFALPHSAARAGSGLTSPLARIEESYTPYLSYTQQLPLDELEDQMATAASTFGSKEPHNPRHTLLFTQSSPNANTTAPGTQLPPRRQTKRNHRAGKKKKKARRKSFAVPDDMDGNGDAMRSSQTLLDQNGGSRPPFTPFYRLGQSNGLNLSDTSLDSDALLDHR